MFVDKLEKEDIEKLIIELVGKKYNITQVSEPKKIKFWTNRIVTLQDQENDECVNAIISDYCCYIKDIPYVREYCNYMLGRFGAPYLKRADEKGVDSKSLLENYIMENIKKGKQTTFDGGLNPYTTKRKRLFQKYTTEAIEKGNQTTLNGCISDTKPRNAHEATTSDIINSENSDSVTNIVEERNLIRVATKTDDFKTSF